MILSQRVALVTGAATGIGRAISLALATEGANIVVADINKEAGAQTAGALQEKGVEATSVLLDVRKGWMAEKVVQAVTDRFGGIDILVNNAGVAGGPGWYEHPESREEDWIATYDVNVKGTVNVVRAVAPVLKQQRRGRIVNIASIAGREGRPALPHYAASKAAVINYTQSLAVDLGPFNITVNAVCPGLLWTPMWEQVGQRYAQFNADYQGLPARDVFDRMVRDLIPLGRDQTPEDVGDCVTFLVSDDAEVITGQAVNVDGGAFLR